MPRHEPLTRSGLTSRAGLSEDIMTFWDRRGLLIPLPRRTPSARRTWPWYEANIAAVMMQLRQFGVPIDGMLQIVGTFREAIAWADRYDLSRDEVFGLWSAFVSHNLVAMHARSPFPRGLDFHQTYEEQLERRLDDWRHERHDAQGMTPKIEATYSAMSREEFEQHINPYLTITEQPGEGAERSRRYHGLTYFWREGDQWKFGNNEDGPRQARDAGALSTIAVDVATVIHDVWSRPR